MSFPSEDTHFSFQPDIASGAHSLSLSLSLSHFLCYHQHNTQTAWLAPSKLLANALEEKLLENSLQQGRLVSVPPLQEVSRSLIAIVLDCCTPRNPSLPKKHRTPYRQVAIPALSEGPYTGSQGRLAFSINIIVSSTRGLRHVHCWSL